MSRLTQKPRIELNVDVRLNESEIRALEALVGYGINPFLDVFYEHIGKHYLQPHEAGLRSLFGTIKSELNPILQRLDGAKKAFALQDPIVRSRAEHDQMLKNLTTGGDQ